MWTSWETQPYSDLSTISIQFSFSRVFSYRHSLLRQFVVKFFFLTDDQIFACAIMGFKLLFLRTFPCFWIGVSRRHWFSLKENLDEQPATGCVISLCPTRWTVRANCFHRIRDNYSALLQ